MSIAVMPGQTTVDDSLTVSWQRAFIALAVGELALFAVFWTTAVSLAHSWARDPLGHGYLVVPATLYLVWARRGELARLSPVPTLWPLPVVLVLAFGWLVGRLTGTDIVQHGCLIGLVIGVVWAVVGTTVLRALAFPLGFLFFALPFADRFVPSLQDITARFAATLLAASGVPVSLQGHAILSPGATWEVAKACSGINYLMSSLALGYIYAGLTYRTWRNRLQFVLAAALIPLVGNGIRVFGTILIASYGVTGIVEGTQHYLFGWLVFGLMVGALFATCGGRREILESSIRVAPLQPQVVRVSSTALVLSTILFAGTVLPMSGLRYLQNPRSAAGDGAVAPSVLSPWLPSTDDPYRWQPRFSGEVSQFARTYHSEGRSVRLHAASYSSLGASANLVSAENVVSERPWSVMDTRSMKYPIGGIVSIQETELGGSGDGLRVWSWYTVGGASTGSDYRAKLLLAKTQLLRRPLSAWYVMIATADHPSDRSSPGETLADFVAHLELTMQAERDAPGGKLVRATEDTPRAASSGGLSLRESAASDE